MEASKVRQICPEAPRAPCDALNDTEQVRYLSLITRILSNLVAVLTASELQDFWLLPLYQGLHLRWYSSIEKYLPLGVC